jgi:hypothetical protein
MDIRSAVKWQKSNRRDVRKREHESDVLSDIMRLSLATALPSIGTRLRHDHAVTGSTSCYVDNHTG